MGQNATTGRIVHYVMPDGKFRPAIVVEDWHSSGGERVNLQVFVDGSNDTRNVSPHEIGHLTIWRTSVEQSEESRPGTWHWPPRT